MRKKILFILLIIAPILTRAQDFEKHFEDKTLRIDYILGGDKDKQFVVADQLVQLPQWAGRKHNLAEIPLQGNGQIKVYDTKSRQCIYANSFSTLFQEWLDTPEAETSSKSFENTFLIPYPKDSVDIEISFRDKNGNYQQMLSHKVDPTDILIKKKGFKNITPYSVVSNSKDCDINQTINVAIVAEGFTRQQMGEFKEFANITVQEILSYPAFSKYKDNFRFYIVESPSTDSGVSVPREKDWRETAVNSHFDTFYSNRYLTTTNIKQLHDILAGIPYEHIIILANTDVYGGGGIYNAYTLTTTGHKDFRPVVVHEFGHSFAGLADEYFYDNDVFSDSYPKQVEPWEQNVTTLVDFDSKWKDLLAPSTPIPTPIENNSPKVGAYEGAAYTAKGVYRGSIDCRMKTNTAKDFCPVCERCIQQLIEFYTK